jgi:oligosaccharyl transferase (archaeosortase A-associated)
MLPMSLSKKQTCLVLGLIVLFSLFALWVRLIPMAGLTAGGEVDLMGNDPWYNMRQVEALAANGLSYPWFDPMTLYPTGQVVHWGPLFPMIIAALAILVGAATRPEIMFVGAIVPPLMGAAMVPLMYLLGRRIADWKTGLLAAGFTAVVAGHFLYRSLFGFVDHHIAEVLFSTLFVLAYIVAIQAVRAEKIDLSSPAGLKKPMILGILAGIAYLLGLFVMPTMILLAMIVAVYTLFQYILDVWEKKETWNLAIINTVVFAVAIVGLFLFGIQHEGLGLARYTLGHVFAYIAIIIGSWALYALARATREKPPYIYPVLLAAIGVVFALLLKVVAPALFDVLIGNFYGFFGQPAEILTVEEAMPWSLEAAWQTFGFGLLLMAGGFAILLYGIVQKRRADYLFVLVWSAIILLSTWQHNRYEYYLAANVALLAGLCAGFVLERGWKEIAAHRAQAAAPAEKKTGKNRKEEKKPSRGSDPAVLLGSVVVVILSAFFVISSLQSGLAVAESSAYGGMDSQWRETMEWMGDNTPDTGVDYYKNYDKETFQYPPQSYGVMSWWDYGHYITFLAKRIPNCNPFQAGVAGPNGSAAFFMAQDEETAAEILTNDGTRYVITDTMMDTGKFWAMATWFDSKAGVQPYQQTWAVPVGQGSLMQARIYTPAYFQTMTSRLHNFDGSMSEPGEVYYTEYVDAASSGYGVPLMTNLSILNAAEAKTKAEAYNATAPAGRHAGIISLEANLTMTAAKAPALQNFRLVHESSGKSFSGQTAPDIRFVKVFEFVPGAHIKGEGTIEVDLTTNTGRTFTYRQESSNGEFVVPYSTSDTPYDVRAAGSYRIVGTGQTFDVSDDAVMQGLTIN